MIPRRSKVILAFCVAVFLLLFMVYTQPFGKGNTARLASILPLPVASVNGSWILYGKAFKRYDGLVRFYASEQKEIGGDFEERLFESLFRERLVRQLMKERDVFVSKEDRQQALQDIQDQVGSREEFEEALETAYGWSLSEFDRHVVRPYVEARTLEEAILRDRDLQAGKRAKIDEAFEKLQDHDVFDGLVLEYSEDATSVFNGDVGWMEEKDLPEAWKGPALHLDVGDTSPVLEERDRFVILRVDDRMEEPRQDTESMIGQELKKSQRVNLSILVVNKISLSEAVQNFASESKVQVWVKL